MIELHSGPGCSSSSGHSKRLANEACCHSPPGAASPSPWPPGPFVTSMTAANNKVVATLLLAALLALHPATADWRTCDEVSGRAAATRKYTG